MSSRDTVDYIDSKRDMQVNIFLRQFASLSPADVVQRLRSGTTGDQLGADRLRSLQKMLPEPDEVDRLIQYTGDRDYLGPAEQFYLELIAIPK
jgi:Formin Homology 2 Domain